MLNPDSREWWYDNGFLVLAAFVIPLFAGLVIAYVKPLRRFFDRFRIGT